MCDVFGDVFGDVCCDVCCDVFVQAYNMLAAQVEQNSSFGRQMDCKVLDVRDVDVRTCARVHTCVHI